MLGSQDSDLDRKESEEGYGTPLAIFLYIYPSPSPKGLFIIHKEYLICPQEPPRKERKYITLILLREWQGIGRIHLNKARRGVEASNGKRLDTGGY